LQAPSALFTWRWVRASDLAAAMAHSWAGFRPTDINGAAWTGMEATRAAAAAAKYSFMFHSPEMRIVVSIAIRLERNLRRQNHVRAHKTQFEKKKDSIGAGLCVVKQ
jgi:hypothetical protein